MAENEHLLSLLSKRQTVMENLTHFLEFFREVYSDDVMTNLDVREVEQRLPRVESLVDKFIMVHNEVQYIMGNIEDHNHTIKRKFDGTVLKILNTIKAILKHESFDEVYRPHRDTMKRYISRINKKVFRVFNTETTFDDNKSDYMNFSKIEFIDAFEIPNLLYKRLSEANRTSPVFLSRTLSYMRYRMSRNHTGRKYFKVNLMLFRKYVRYVTLDIDDLEDDYHPEQATLDVFLVDYVKEKKVGSFQVLINGNRRISKKITFPVNIKAYEEAYNVFFRLKLPNQSKVVNRKVLRRTKVNERSEEYGGNLHICDFINAGTIKEGRYEILLQSPRYDTGGSISLKIDIRLQNTSKPVGIEEVSKLKIVYEFRYRTISQCTAPCKTAHCPWCNVDCRNLNTLMNHLQLYHMRFRFQCNSYNEGTYITVRLNLDGHYSYSNDLMAPPGEDMEKEPRTQLFVKKYFLEDRQTIRKNLMSRWYYHETGMPISAGNGNSDEGTGTEWLTQLMSMKVDKNAGLDEGDKEFMKMWNMHMKRHTYLGWCHLPKACETFVKSNGKIVIEKELYNSFVAHMSNLVISGLIEAKTMRNIVVLLQQYRRTKIM